MACLTTTHCHNHEGSKGWCQEPGIGEADNPGPPTTRSHCSFDDPEAQAWSEDEPFSTQAFYPFPGEPEWTPGPEDEAYGEEPDGPQQPAPSTTSLGSPASKRRKNTRTPYKPPSVQRDSID